MNATRMSNTEIVIGPHVVDIESLIHRTVYVEIYAGTFFRGFEGAHVYACTNIRGSDPDYSPLFFYNRLNSVEIYKFTPVFTFVVRA